MSDPANKPSSRFAWLRATNRQQPENAQPVSDLEAAAAAPPIPRWSLGVLNDKHTDEVPGSVLLMSENEAAHNEPLGLRHVAGRNSTSSIPSIISRPSQSQRAVSFREPVKKTSDGRIILEPQPDDSANDPLNWPSWRRDVALVCLGFFCMLGGGMTTILAAGFNNVAATYGVSVPQVSLTTGLYMLGLGLGSVIFSPTAILWGKRPVYLLGGVLFIISSVWCALSPNYASLVVARIFQGIAVSPVECLPSATIAEIFFLHERAYRLGIYTLLLLGGKNLIPLVSAAIINSLGWRWVFWIIAIAVGGATVLIFFFVPETFWDRSFSPPKQKRRNRFSAIASILSPALSRRNTKSCLASVRSGRHGHGHEDQVAILGTEDEIEIEGIVEQGSESRSKMGLLARIDASDSSSEDLPAAKLEADVCHEGAQPRETEPVREKEAPEKDNDAAAGLSSGQVKDPEKAYIPQASSDYEAGLQDPEKAAGSLEKRTAEPEKKARPPTPPNPHVLSEKLTASAAYTNRLASQPPLSYWQMLRPWNGRIRKDTWLKCMVRPFVLFAYPAVLWSALIYATSVGWLIVLSESVSTIFRGKEYGYDYSALQTGLVYLSPFIGGVLGSAVSGRISDVVVRAMARRNDGIYEPEFRLVMSAPILVSTVAGIMGFGWSAWDRDAWIVPTIFFGIIAFGCTLGSATAITFAVDSYREYAGEALVTLNFSKNVLHGLVFSLFFTGWLEADGSKMVFLTIGGCQIAVVLTAVPMYIYGKRLRMWTVRKKMMARFQ